MAAIAQTIAIVDRSGKVVSTSKQLKNVFKEAKLAYLERKAEITADRKEREDRELRKAIKAMSVAEDEARSNASPSRRRRSHTPREDHHSRRPSAGSRHHSNASIHSGHSGRSSLSESPRSRSGHPSPPHGQFNESFETSRSAPVSPVELQQPTELIRRQTDLPLSQIRRKPVRSHSAASLDAGDIDMDLAYGEYHPSSLALSPRVEQQLQKQELSSLVTKFNLLLDEANCAQHSVKAIVAHLQKNPDAMAAVALTLAEISNIASKMAPGALMALKSGAPTVFAMLAAPEFLIAVGVGVGITVVMFGGYKIIKKIKASATNGGKEASMDEMLEVGELDRIENWRRGIADDAMETASVATSVEGEFITPIAAASMGHLPVPKGKEKKTKGEKKTKHRSSRRGGDEASEAGSQRSEKSGSSSRSDRKDRALIKVKKPSPLRRMFTSRDTNSTAS